MTTEGIRINKFISDSGYCSRREADTYLEMGRVTINGRTARLGDSVAPKDRVEVDGERVGHKLRRAVYIALNKPVGVTSTTDQADPTNVIDFIGFRERIFPVGRLDKDSEGLMLLTNDGDIVNKILRAGNNHVKEYVVWVDKPLTSEFISNMSSGVKIPEAVTRPCRVVRLGENCFTIYLTQGLNRQIRRMCEVLGYKVQRLKRVRIMNIGLGNIEVGKWRYLTPAEVEEIYDMIGDSVGTAEASVVEQSRSARSLSTKRSGSKQADTEEAGLDHKPKRHLGTKGAPTKGKVKTFNDYRRRGRS